VQVVLSSTLARSSLRCPLHGVLQQQARAAPSRTDLSALSPAVLVAAAVAVVVVAVVTP